MTLPWGEAFRLFGFPVPIRKKGMHCCHDSGRDGLPTGDQSDRLAFDKRRCETTIEESVSSQISDIVGADAARAAIE
jgi:hypothetical protein